PPYFNSVFVPLMTPLLVALGVGPLLTWKRADLGAALREMRIAAVVTALVVFLVALSVEWATAPALLGVPLGLWAAGGVFSDLAHKLRIADKGLGGLGGRLRRLPRAQWGMSLAHLGVGVLILGITATSVWEKERLEIVKPGESLELAGHVFTLDAVRPVPGPNYTAIQAVFTVTRDGRKVATLTPETRGYVNPPMVTTEAAIWPVWAGELYAAVGEASGDDTWAVRLYFKPLQGWLWIGALMMAAGGIVSLTDRRYRVGAPERRRRAAAAPQAAE